MLFFFHNTFADVPVGHNGNGVNATICFTQTTLDNEFNIVNQPGRYHRILLRINEFLVFFHDAKVHHIIN